MSPVDHFDVVVIGLGAMGSAAAYESTRRGRRVLGIEQFTPAHELGSSHGQTRIVRKAYYEKPDYVPLLQRSYELWDDLSARYGQQLFTRCGSLMIGAADSPVVTGTLESARRWSLPHEILDARQLRARFPQFAMPDDQRAVFEADAGFALAEPSVLANLELAMADGAELWFDTVVEAVELGRSGVHITAGGTELTADKVVVATGAWASRLAKLEQYPLNVQRQTVHRYEPASGSSGLTDFDPDRFPVYIWDWPMPEAEPTTELYGFPHQPGDAGVKIGIYHDGYDVDPDELDRTVGPGDAARLTELLPHTLPGLAGPWQSGTACMYTALPGDDFMLGLHPGGSGRVVLALGFSGHGFKFMPVVGEIVADLVVDGRTRHDIDFLSPARFARRA